MLKTHHEDIDSMCEGLERLNISADKSLYQTESSESSNGEERERSNIVQRRLKLNEFLALCGKDSVKQSKKPWEISSTRTKKDRIMKMNDAVVATLHIISPDDPLSLWQGLRESQAVEKALGLESKEDEKYLSALADTYDHAASWNTKRQILSIMADLVTSTVLKKYIPDITEYQIKTARKHKAMYGRGTPLELKKSPRMKVDDAQLDHFLSFVTSPHVIQDLPFGLRLLHLSNGKVLETPNVIRTMIPQRIVEQYRQYCSEYNFTPFSNSTMLRILSCCSASVRKSLHGLDYFTAEGAKAIDNLITIVEKVGGQDKEWKLECIKSLKEGKHYLKTDFKVYIISR